MIKIMACHHDPSHNNRNRQCDSLFNFHVTVSVDFGFNFSLPHIFSAVLHPNSIVETSHNPYQNPDENVALCAN
jgi:hypothetical protein